MRIVFMGTPESSAEILASLLENGEEITGVFTQPDKPKGRGLLISESSVKELAEEHQLPIFQPEDLKDPQILEDLKLLQPEIIVVVAYGKIIPRDILNFPKYGCINVHFSLLPKYRGASPISAAIRNGETESGVTIFKIQEKLDTGPIFSQARLKIEDSDTAGMLEAKLTAVAQDLLPRTLPDIVSGEVDGMPQDESKATYAHQLKKADGLIDWENSAKNIQNLVRAMDPWPCAFTRLGGKLLKIWKAAEIRNSKLEIRNKSGTMIEINDEGIVVQTGDGLLLLTEVQLEGGRRMNAAEFLKGHPLKIGCAFS